MSTGNPLWRHLTQLDGATRGALAAQRRTGARKLPHPRRDSGLGPEYAVTTCLRMLGISGEWRRRLLAGHIPDPERLRSRIEDLLQRLNRLDTNTRTAGALSTADHNLALTVRDSLREFLKSYDSPTSNVYVAAAALGLEVDECQRELDTIIFSHRPFMTGLFFEDTANGKAMADEALKYLRGYYRAYLRREAHRADGQAIYLQCTLRVRYVLRLDGGYGIRVKLNLPVMNPTEHEVELAKSLHGEPPIIEYDGFVVPRDKCYWVLIQRTLLPDGDMMSLITSNERERGLDMRGRYLTLGQDHAKSIVDDDVVLKRIPDDEIREFDAQTRGKITRSGVRTIRAGEKGYEAVARLFRPSAAAHRSGRAQRE